MERVTPHQTCNLSVNALKFFRHFLRPTEITILNLHFLGIKTAEVNAKDSTTLLINYLNATVQHSRRSTVFII